MPSRTAFSLRWKIIAWLFLNFLLIAAGLLIYLRAQFGLGFKSLLADPADDRLETIGRALRGPLRIQPVAQWNAILTRATQNWRRQGVKSALFRDDGSFVAGDIPQLPREIQRLVNQYAVPLGSGALSARPKTLAGRRLPKVLQSTSNPRLYWAVVFLGQPKKPAPGSPSSSVSLVLVSKSMTGEGLFFDFGPWLALGGGVVGISLLLWLPLVHRMTGAVTAMTRTAESIAQGRFEPVRPSRRRDELGRLGRALHHMSARLEGFVKGQRRFLGDTAHELLSPLSRLDMTLAILAKKVPPEHRHYIARAQAETECICDLVQELLSFSKAGFAEAAPQLEDVDVLELANEVVSRENAASAVSVQVPAGLRVRAVRDLLGRALGNAVRNALRYAADAGPIEITGVDNADRTAAVGVRDHGPGVPAEELPRLFDPFYRPDLARDRESGGAGLGLAIVKSCIEACGGSAAAANCDPSGLEVTFTLQQATSAS